MEPNYCLPIMKADKSEILDLINASLGLYTYFEVWLDYVDDLDDGFIRQLIDLLGHRLVVTTRRQELKPPLMDPSRRQEVLALFDGTDCLVDLDITTQKAELDYVKSKGLALSLLISYHDYHETPDTLQLNGITDTMKVYQPEIYKLSTHCVSAEDTVRLLSLLLELKRQGLKAIVLGMGRYGEATRVFGLLWGNEMVFAPLSKQKSSDPGQLTRGQLDTILKELDK